MMIRKECAVSYGTLGSIPIVECPDNCKEPETESLR